MQPAGPKRPTADGNSRWRTFCRLDLLSPPRALRWRNAPIESYNQVMWLATMLIGFILTVSCAGVATPPDEWEYRVIDDHDYYGFESAEDMQAVILRGEFMDCLSAAKNRWGSEGWDFAPDRGELGGGRLLLRRSRSNPAAFEVRFVMQQELGQVPAESAQDRINQLVRDGWTLKRGDLVCLEFHPAR